MFITFVQGIYNNIPQMGHISRVYSIAALLYSQFMVHVLMMILLLFFCFVFVFIVTAAAVLNLKLLTNCTCSVFGSPMRNEQKDGRLTFIILGLI